MPTRRSVMRTMGYLVLSPLYWLPFRPPQAAVGNDLGILTPFYRSTQLQGHLIGMGVMEIPDYVTAVHDGLQYKKRPNASKEIPFVDTFTINRFLGGYRGDWIQKFHLTEEELGRRSLDYVVKQNDGSLRFRPELIRRRLEPYLQAGYRPQDITIALENVPWDLATPNGAPAEEGTWGRRSPPGNLDEWERVIRQFGADLKTYLGSTAETTRFETGVEYDEKSGFNASQSDFFRYYELTDRALHAVLPTAELNPGEFTGLGVCSPKASSCVYDTAAFLAFAAQQHLSVHHVPRSLHSFLDRPANSWPSTTAQRASQSYRRLPSSVVPSIHQFGLLSEPFGNAGSDPAARQANWEFQVLMRLWATLRPNRVFHWGGFTTVGKMPFLNGSGFLRLVLDRYLGFRAQSLDLHDALPSGKAEVMAVGFVDGGHSAIIASSFSFNAPDAQRRVLIRLPPNLLSGRRTMKTIRYRQSANIFMTIRNHLAAEDNLKPAFAACDHCLADPTSMATDGARARAMLSRNWQQYTLALTNSLKWVAADPGVVRSDAQLTVTLDPNEMIILE